MANPRLRPLAAVLCGLPLAVAAQSSTPPAAEPHEIQSLPDIVVTASRSAEPLADVVGDVTIVGTPQLQAARGDSLAEILVREPGVQFVSSGGPQTATSVSLRGANAQHTLVLIDGMPINGATTGLAQFPALDPAMIERVEILRGSASSLYGSDAVGGVINIITKKGEQDRPLSAWANVGYGSHETAKSSLGVSGASQGWDYSFSASAASSHGFDASRRIKATNQPNFTHNPDRDGYRQHAVSGTLGYQWAAGHRLGLTAYNGYMDGDYDAGDSVANAHALWRQQAYGISSTDRITDWWESELRFAFANDSYEDRGYQSQFNAIGRQYSWTNTFKPYKDQQIALLLEHKEERVQGSTDYVRDARNTNAVGLIYKGRFDRLRTQASIRNDNYTDYGDQTTYSLGLDLDLSETVQVGILGSTGFHAPTFNDLYYPYELYTFMGFPVGSYSGNPDLKPEKSRNIEAHIQYQQADTLLRATVYQNRIDDLIIYQVTQPVAFFDAGTMRNLNKATIRGLTLSAEQGFGQTTVRASADFLDPRNDDPQPGQGSELPRRARQMFNLGVQHRIQAWKLGAEYQYTGNRYDDDANKVRLGGYSLVNLTASYDFNKSLGMQVRWNNVLDKDYVLIDGYNMPGSNVFMNLSWRM